MYKPTAGAAATLEAISRRSSAARAVLLTGAPGAGKTAFSAWVAEQTESQYVYSMLHSWSDDQELFCGIDVAAAVAGDVDAIRQPGVLAAAAAATAAGPVVLCLDEIDKAPDRVEYLLLDFLQSGRVPVAPGRHVQAVLENLVVVITSNATRQLSDALLRRVRRLHLAPLAGEAMIEAVAERAGVPVGFARSVARACDAADQISLQEIAGACEDVWFASSFEVARVTASQWLRRDGGLVAKDRLAAAWAIASQASRERRMTAPVSPWVGQ